MIQFRGGGVAGAGGASRADVTRIAQLDDPPHLLDPQILGHQIRDPGIAPSPALGPPEEMTQMLDRLQFLILCSCADGWQLFYFPFAAANFGGQVFAGRTDVGQEPGRFRDDREAWPVSHDGTTVGRAIGELIHLRFLAWRTWRSPRDSDAPFQTVPIPADELLLYRDYDCVTYGDHINRYGYGPHEFFITEAGRVEIQSPRYAAWVDDDGRPRAE